METGAYLAGRLSTNVCGVGRGPFQGENLAKQGLQTLVQKHSFI